MDNTAAAHALEFLTFTLGDEEYGLDIQAVQELRGYEAVTRIANAPEHIKGVVNLRGIIVPILDLRLLLATGTPTYDQFTVVIVLNTGGRTFGAVVDSVSDVTMLTPGQIKPAPELAVVDAHYVTGIATVAERLLILIDIERLVALDDLPLAA